jgi:tRNA threonylcarbamoyl adenosine modification protein YjeE
MFPTAPGNFSFNAALADEGGTYGLMADIAAVIEPGDVITLSGDLGAGKTTFARALIRFFAGDENIEVPSPTFTLTQSYALPRFTLVHADLYRLAGPAELAEIGLDDAADGAVLVIEWPDRAGALLPVDRLDIAFTLVPQQGPNARNARITGHGRFAARVERIVAMRRFLDRTGYGRATRQRIQGDASTRSYERLTRDGATYIFMNSPKRPDGPPVRDGQPYSAIAHLAENVTPFVAMAHALRGRGFSAPAIFAADRNAGLLVIEDLGDEQFVAGDPPAPIEARYEAATDLLAELHGDTPPAIVPVEPGVDYQLPQYDMEAFLIEAELLLDWYLPKLGVKINDIKRNAFRSHWQELLLPLTIGAQTWVLRDVHSPNLLWLPEREGIARVGLLDFQDAMMGPAAYDLASLLQDARVDVPEMTEIALLSRYVRARMRKGSFDASDFARSYATLAAQRASKILGIFARLERRDRKPQYLRHMPRVWSYLQRSLAHPDLAPLAAWYRTNVPALKV